MTHYKKDEVLAIDIECGIFCVECYDGNMNNIKGNNIVTENDFNDEDWYFCDKCGTKLN